MIANEEDTSRDFRPTVPAVDLGVLERNGHDSPAAHRDRIQRKFASEFGAKYDVGQSEHGGCLSRKPVAHEIKQEVLDLVAYIYTAEEQLHHAIGLLSKAIKHQDWGVATKALAVLVTGNDKGERA